MTAVPHPDLDGFDWKKPDYSLIYQRRYRRLQAVRSDPKILQAMKVHYRESPGGLADFITDWGVTFDPRNVERGLPAVVPLLLFQRQREWVDWFLERWRGQEDGITEKSRDMGVSWLCVGVAASLCLLREGVAIGFGSRKEMYVDQAAWPGSLFWKARAFIEGLPPEFRGGWVRSKHSAHMRIQFPETGSAMSGEAGDNIGRGDRASVYFTDEDAFIERPTLVDASLSQTTNCRIRVSSVNGMANPFAIMRHSGRVPVFTFHWRDDPRKDEAWYARQEAKLDPIIVAQEIDINYKAGVTGVLIPYEWIEAAIGAHEVLGFTPTGSHRGALDVADEGRDKNGFAAAHGVHVRACEEWSGVGSDIFDTTKKAFEYCVLLGLHEFYYDADGLGSGVRGDARVINEAREASGQRPVKVSAFRGSGAVVDPDDPIPAIDENPNEYKENPEDARERLNKDFFLNAKAQGWWALRVRFQRTFRLVQQVKQGIPLTAFDPDQLISLDRGLPRLDQLKIELSQPTYKTTEAGKLVVDKAPDGMKSPNLGDAVMILFAPKENRRSFFDLDD